MSYVGAAANIVGGELSGWANLLERNAMYGAYKDELGLQQGYQDQAMGAFNKNVQAQGAGAAIQDLKQGATNREGLYNRINQVPLSPTATPGDSGVEGRRNQAYAAQRGQARASLGAYGDWAFQKTLNDIQNRESLGQIINFAKGTAGVFPYKMYKAQHSMDDLAMIGAAISSIGGGAANYAQFAQAPGAGGNNMAFGAGLATDPYGVQYQYNPYGQIYSGVGAGGGAQYGAPIGPTPSGDALGY